jgi:RNA polymerase sigma factor (sigma-70 family)
VQTHQRTCAHVIGRMVGDRDQVADLLQETFLAVFRQLHRFRFESSLRTWVSRVAYTTALPPHLRRRRLEAQWMVVEVPEELGIGDEGRGRTERGAAGGRQLGAALERLSAPQRLIVGLHYLEDFDLAEIEQVTGAGTRYHQEPPVPRAPGPEAGTDAARHRRRTAVNPPTDPRDAEARCWRTGVAEQARRSNAGCERGAAEAHCR